MVRAGYSTQHAGAALRRFTPSRGCSGIAPRTTPRTPHTRWFFALCGYALVRGLLATSWLVYGLPLPPCPFPSRFLTFTLHTPQPSFTRVWFWFIHTACHGFFGYAYLVTYVACTWLSLPLVLAHMVGHAPLDSKRANSLIIWQRTAMDGFIARWVAFTWILVPHAPHSLIRGLPGFGSCYIRHRTFIAPVLAPRPCAHGFPGFGYATYRCVPFATPFGWIASPAHLSVSSHTLVYRLDIIRLLRLRCRTLASPHLWHT